MGAVAVHPSFANPSVGSQGRELPKTRTDLPQRLLQRKLAAREAVPIETISRRISWMPAT